MKICLYSPYVPKHFGGGEKYFFDVAMTFRDLGHQVMIAIPLVEVASGDKKIISENRIRRKYEKFLGVSLEGIRFVESPLGSKARFMTKAAWTEKFDLIYHITDGSVFWSFARNNVMHVQTPVRRGIFSIHEKLKFTRWNFVNTNSKFTKKVVEENWGIPVNAVHYPSVEIYKISELAKKHKKQKTIIHVGRFFRQQHSKRQDTLVKFFSELIKKYPKIAKGWKLVLIGSVEDKSYANEVRKLAKGLPVEIYHTLSREELLKKYAEASIYWHATGFGIDEELNPEKAEHFGITTVEAMAAGVVPVVINKGGQPEVLGSGLKDLSWNDQKVCLEITSKLMKNGKERKKWAKKAQNRSKKFNQRVFKKNIESMLAQLKQK